MECLTLGYWLVSLWMLFIYIATCNSLDVQKVKYAMKNTSTHVCTCMCSSLVLEIFSHDNQCILVVILQFVCASSCVDVMVSICPATVQYVHVYVHMCLCVVCFVKRLILLVFQVHMELMLQVSLPVTFLIVKNGMGLLLVLKLYQLRLVTHDWAQWRQQVP